jgi:hypothetical protein
MLWYDDDTMVSATTNSCVRVTLRLPDELHRRLEARARAAGASLNQTIVSTLHEALARAAPATDDRAEALRHIRMALGDLVVALDDAELPPELRPADDLPDVDTLRESMPRLDPPLSRTIIDDRADRV